MKQSPRKYTISQTLFMSILILYTYITCNALVTKGLSLLKEEPASTSSYVQTFPEGHNNVSASITNIELISLDKQAKPLTEHEQINKYITDVCSLYPNVDPSLIMSIVEHESRYQPQVENGKCIGLMQVSSYWNKSRMEKLGVTNLHDPHDNILVGVDYISELLTKYKDTSLVLMLYNMDWNTAFKMHKQGRVSNYAKSVLARQTEIQKSLEV